MTAQYLLAFSQKAEPIVFSCLALSLMALILALRKWCPNAARDNRPTMERLEAALAPRIERGVLAAIILAALFLRLWGWNNAYTAPWWFTQLEPVDVAAALRQGGIFAQFSSLLQEFHGRSVTQSPVLLPVALLFQAIFGASSRLPVLAGGIIGTVLVVFVWLLARQTHSKVFGLLVAALIAVSPLQIVWSRTGGVEYFVSLGIFTSILTAFSAGSRRSVMLSVLAALATWSCLYLYYAARIAFPLSCLALVLGVARARGTVWAALKLTAVLLFVWCALYFALPTKDFKPTFWPFFPGYVGNKAEATLTELIERNITSVSAESQRMLKTYFFYGRASDLAQAEQRFNSGDFWGMERGGLCLLPVAGLGLLGLLSATRRPLRHLLWLALTFFGFALVALSQTAARRIAVFDAGWCALAAVGFLALIEAPLIRRLSSRALGWLLGGTVLLFGCWSFGSIAVLNRALPAAPSGIPFGQGYYGDGCTCLACYQAGERWREEFKRDISVVLFDSDRAREYVTCPGGLGLYGRLAALSHATAQSADRFFEFYPIWRNLNYRWEENSLYPVGSDPIEYLIQQLRLARTSEIEWHFEVPTQWERWLAEQLISVGGTRVSFHSPLSRTDSFIVRTTFEQREKVFEVLRERLRPESPHAEACLVLSDEGGESFLPQPLIVAPFAQPKTKDTRPTWIVSTGSSVQIDSESVPAESIIAAAPDTTNEAALNAADLARPQAVQLLAHNRDPEFLRYDLSTKTLRGVERPSVRPIGVGCAAYVQSEWWVADSITGAIRSSGDASWIPQGTWLGIAPFGERGLILASRNQELEIVDVVSRQSLFKFPATLIPSFERDYGECVGVAAGEGWVATANFSSSLITLYTDSGKHIASFSLSRYLKLPAPNIMNITGMGNALGIVVGFDKSVRTLLLSARPDLKTCAEAPAEEQAKLYQQSERRITLNGIEPESVSQDWGVATADRTVSNELLKVGGITYRHGYGVHANSRLVFNIGGRYSSFAAAVGLPDHITNTHPASVIFRIIGDGKTLWDSGVIRAGTGSKPVQIDLQGVKQLELVVTDAGDGIQYDHACWLDPKLTQAPP